MMVARGYGEGEMESCFSMGTEFQFYKIKSFYRSVTQQCEDNLYYRTVHLKMINRVNFILDVFSNHN